MKRYIGILAATAAMSLFVPVAAFADENALSAELSMGGRTVRAAMPATDASIRAHIPVVKTPDGGSYMFAVPSVASAAPGPFTQCGNGSWYTVFTGVVEPDLRLRLHVVPTCVSGTAGTVVWDARYFASETPPTVTDLGTRFEVKWAVKECFGAAAACGDNGTFTLAVNKTAIP